MLSREDSDLLTKVSNGAPMGRMMKQHWWIPAALSEKLVADGAPQRVRLFGGRLAIDSRPGEGLQLRVTLPLPTGASA